MSSRWLGKGGREGVHLDPLRFLDVIEPEVVKVLGFPKGIIEASEQDQIMLPQCHAVTRSLMIHYSQDVSCCPRKETGKIEEDEKIIWTNLGCGFSLTSNLSH